MMRRISRRTFMVGIGGAVASTVLVWGPWALMRRPLGSGGHHPIIEGDGAYVDHDGWLVTTADKERMPATLDNTDARVGAVIKVRWVDNLGDTERTALERALGLYRAELSEGTTWSYRVPDASPQRLREIVAHDMLADTAGFDRGTLQLHAPANDTR